MRVSFVVLFVLLLLNVSAYAADKKQAASPSAAAAPAAGFGFDVHPKEVVLYGGRNSGVYAFPGKECPVGSHLYKGPEQLEIAKTNYVYCRFSRRYVWIQKTKGMTKCPDGKDPVPAGIKDDSIMWCDLPHAVIASTGVIINKDELNKSVKAGKSDKTAPAEDEDEGK